MSTLDRHDWLSAWCRLRIPKTYHASPVLSHLASQYGLAVRITAACLDVKGMQDGCFDLVISGQPYQMLGGLRYLQHLQVEIAQYGPQTFLPDLSHTAHPLPLAEPATLQSSPSSNPIQVLVLPERGVAIQTHEVEVTVPRELCYRSVLFNLVHNHHLAMTIMGALLEPNSPEPGRFDLRLSGTQSSIESGLASLRQQVLVA